MTLQQFAGYVAGASKDRELGLQALIIAAGGKILPEDARLWHRGEPRRLEKLIAALRAHGCAQGNLTGALVHQGCKLPLLYPLPPWLQTSIGFPDDLVDAMAPVPLVSAPSAPPIRTEDRIVPLNPSSSGSDPNRSDPVGNPVLNEARSFERQRLYDLIGWHESKTGFARTVWEPGLRRIRLSDLQQTISEAREKRVPVQWLNAAFRTLLAAAPHPKP